MKPREMHCFNCRHYHTPETYCDFWKARRDQTYQCEYWKQHELYEYEKEGKK